jgi:hypothetical protein
MEPEAGSRLHLSTDAMRRIDARWREVHALAELGALLDPDGTRGRWWTAGEPNRLRPTLTTNPSARWRLASVRAPRPGAGRGGKIRPFGDSMVSQRKKA